LIAAPILNNKNNTSPVNIAFEIKNCMWSPCLLTDRDEMRNLHRGHSIDASYQVSVTAMFANRSGRNEQSS
jgi:hypothetical protein